MSIWGCGSPVSYCQPSAAAGFVYLEFSWLHATFVSSSTQPYPLFAISVFFIYSSRAECSSPTFWWSVPHFSRFYKPSPLQAHWGRWCHTHLLWSACLFTLLWGTAPPHSPELRAPHPLCYMSFFQLLVYYSDFFSLFFPGWGSVCPEGYSDLTQGCLWEYHMLLSSHGGLLLPRRLGSGIWWPGSTPVFSV
jgi:hypothetical protein